jgi:SnoaL-like domain
MDEAIAHRLIQSYLEGWKQLDLSMVLSSLSENGVIIESHGPTYQGIEEVKRWINCWIKTGSRVLRWDLRSFYFVDKEKTAFFEWDFHCVANQRDYVLAGSSLVKFSGEKIAFIHEYCMTHMPHPWVKDMLQLE